MSVVDGVSVVVVDEATVTGNDRTTGAAACQVASPGWKNDSEHVPVPIGVITNESGVPPALTVQTVGVVDFAPAPSPDEPTTPLTDTGAPFEAGGRIAGTVRDWSAPTRDGENSVVPLDAPLPRSPFSSSPQQ